MPPTPPPDAGTPSGLIMFLFIFFAILVILGLLGLNHWVTTGGIGRAWAAFQARSANVPAPIIRAPEAAPGAEPAPHTHAENQGAEGAGAVPALVLSADEMARVRLAIAHKINYPKDNKETVIAACWGVRKSGTNPVYQRASFLFEQLLRDPGQADRQLRATPAAAPAKQPVTS